MQIKIRARINPSFFAQLLGSLSRRRYSRIYRPPESRHFEFGHPRAIRADEVSLDDVIAAVLQDDAAASGPCIKAIDDQPSDGAVAWIDHQTIDVGRGQLSVYLDKQVGIVAYG